jgi:hypothetical protein
LCHTGLLAALHFALQLLDDALVALAHVDLRFAPQPHGLLQR